MDRFTSVLDAIKSQEVVKTIVRVVDVFTEVISIYVEVC